MPLINQEEVLINTGNVMLVDANKVNVNPNMTNSIPQYQDMFIFAELTAERRGRSVITIKSNGPSTVTSQDTGLNQDITVNFLGNNQDINSPNYLNFTTNWYDGSSKEGKQFEGFGITSIKVEVNSSYIPQVNIQFVDIRGLAFFNQTNSPYRIIFDFPPPIFYLTIKGYYGMALKYQLHLVKYNTEFRAENGNYVIDAQFIAMTYAPLTDILFRYVVNFPLITQKFSISPETSEPPKNTFELITKLKNLYSAIPEKLNTDVQAKAYQGIQQQLTKVDDLIFSLAGFKSNEDLKKYGTPLLLMYNNTYQASGGEQLKVIQGINEYDNYLKTIPTDGQPVNLEQRLYIGYLMGTGIHVIGREENVETQDITEQKNNITKKVLAPYRLTLLSNAEAKIAGLISTKDIPEIKPEGFNTNPNKADNTDTSDTYVYIDVTNYYSKLYKEKAALTKQKVETMNSLTLKINNMVAQNLGMNPTIYNIFKILLNDVDTFFTILRETSRSAENDHHVRFKNQIITPNFQDKGSINNPNDKIYAFPLIIKQEKICDQTKETRTAPIDISNSLTEPFPEMKLVADFIKTFLDQKKISEQLSLKGDQNADGSFKWIPISPADSKLATIGLQTPYLGCDNTDGGSSSQPIPISEDNRLTDVFKKFLTRFYILSQNSLGDSFYKKDDGSKAWVNTEAKAEAINLVLSITNPTYTKLLHTAAQTFSGPGGVNAFYSYVKKYCDNVPTKHYYAFDEVDRLYFSMNGNGDDLYANKNNVNFQGLDVSAVPIILQTPQDKTTLIGAFQDEVKNTGWKKFIGRTKELGYFNFTQENVLYLQDGESDNPTVGPSNVNTASRYIGSAPTKAFFGLIDRSGIITCHDGDKNDVEFAVNQLTANGNTGNRRGNKLKSIPILSSSGNTGFDFVQNYNGERVAITPNNDDAKRLRTNGDIVEVWVNQLAAHDTEIFDTILNPDSPTFNLYLSQLMLVSNFGYTLSPFNFFPGDLNNLIFQLPAGFEIPQFLSWYMGALYNVTQGSDKYNMIYDFFTTGAGKALDSCGLFIFADTYDVNNYLSSTDKEIFQQNYNTLYLGNSNGGDGSMYRTIITTLKDLYYKANPELNTPKGEKLTPKEKRAVYLNNLQAGGSKYETTIGYLISRTTLLNFSQLTFNKSAKNRPVVGYTSLNKINTDAANGVQTAIDKKTINDDFFKQFFTELESKIVDKGTQLVNEQIENEKLTGDEDIQTQTYYSFKTINDKWLTGPMFNNQVSGYPTFSEKTTDRKLINSFAFVDRAMNPIGDTIINPEILTTMLDDQNVSFFTVISQLLSTNGFEFFPLQNFMAYGKPEEWMQAFAIDTEISVVDSPTFVCMYIGGGSSYPSGIEAFGNFKDDGIQDISAPGTSDFSLNPCPAVPEDDNQVEDNPTFPYRQVRAFRVRFGEQNQSMFTNIKIDSKDYPETNESIQILARLAGDGQPSAPVPKGQNLYNLYENRSYKATITALGNVMIQPTQYFQIENVPLYDGAYIILNVQHDIEPNKMTTVFSGMKILKFPVPRVLQAASLFGFDGGNTNETNPAMTSDDEITLGVGSAGNPPQAQFNSMYKLKIQ